MEDSAHKLAVIESLSAIWLAVIKIQEFRSETEVGGNEWKTYTKIIDQITKCGDQIAKEEHLPEFGYTWCG